jgi:hypothetical protein
MPGTSSLRVLFLLSFVLVILVSEADGQHGRWIAHAPPSGSGSTLAGCGDNVLVYSRSQSATCLFFDVLRSEWTDVQLGSTRAFAAVEASGDVGFALTDSLLVGYSARTGAWDTVRPYGKPLNTISRVSGTMAIHATEEALFVFDSELGQWVIHPRSLPSNYSGGGVAWVKDAYALMVYASTSTGCSYTVYSFACHAFNTLDLGAPPAEMEDGCAGFYDAGTQVNLTGYVASTNSFSTHSFLKQLTESVSASVESPTGTTFGVAHIEILVLGQSTKVNLYCFDTRRGGWDWAWRDVNPQYESFAGLGAGDHLAAFYFTDVSTEQITFVIYSGLSGTYVTRPNRTFTQGTSIDFGSTFLMVVDSLKGWTYDVDGGSEHFQLVEGSWQVSNRFAVNSMGSFSRWHPAADTMTTYFYSKAAGGWESERLSQLSYDYYTASRNIFLLQIPSAFPVVLFYSGVVGEWSRYEFPAMGASSAAMSANLSFAWSGNAGMLFDGTTGSLIPVSSGGTSAAVGDSVFIYWDAARGIHGYNTLSHTWSTETMAEDGYTRDAKGHIGLVSTTSGVVGFHAYYAYNGLYNCWVSLLPEGTVVSHYLGTRSALVVRSSLLYAFAPFLPTGVERDVAIPRTVRLDQNFPNPFNPTTVISCQWSDISDVRLVVYDLLGREVAVLMNGRKPPGKYDVEFDASGLATGVYYYRLNAGTFTQTKKLLLLR